MQQRKTFSSELSIQHSTLQRITTLRIRSMKNSKNSTRNDCREAGPGVPGDRGLRGPWEPGDPGPDQRGTRTDADIQNHILRVPMPGDRVSGMEVEVRRARPDDPDPGVGRHLRGDGEGTILRGEERQAARRSGARRARPLYALDLIEMQHTLWIMFPVDIMYSSMSSLSRNTCSGSS